MRNTQFLQICGKTTERILSNLGFNPEQEDTVILITKNFNKYSVSKFKLKIFNKVHKTANNRRMPRKICYVTSKRPEMS